MDAPSMYITVNIHKTSPPGSGSEIEVTSPHAYYSKGPYPGTLYYTRLPAGMSEEDVIENIVRKDWHFISTAEYNFLAVFVSNNGSNLTLVRDRYGSQRVLIGNFDDDLIVTTDPWATKHSESKWNPIALRYALVSRIITEVALEEGVSILPLLHGITYDERNGLSIFETGSEKLRIQENENAVSDDELIESIKESIYESYRWIKADEPVAVLLSGGVDSFILAAIACQVFGRIKAYTPTWDISDNPELERATVFAKNLGIEHHIITINVDNLNLSFFEMIEANGVPIRNYSSLVLHALFKHIPQENILYGEYADTMFGSFPVKVGIMDEKYARFLRLIPNMYIPTRIKPLISSIKGGGLGKLIQIPSITEKFIEKTLNHIGVIYHGENLSGQKKRFTRVAGIEFNLKTDCSQHMLEIETSALLLGKKIITPFYNQRMVALSNKLTNRQMFGPNEFSIPKNFRKDTSKQVKPLLKKLACQFIEPEAIYLKKLGFPTPFLGLINDFIIPERHFYSEILAEVKNAEETWSALNLMYIINRQKASS